MREVIFCDVCESIIESSICPSCFYNNYYQFVQRCHDDKIAKFIEDNDCFTEDVLANALMERFGICYDDANNLLIGYVDENN